MEKSWRETGAPGRRGLLEKRSDDWGKMSPQNSVAE